MEGWPLVVLLLLAARATSQDDLQGRFSEGLPPGDEVRWEDIASWKDLPNGAVWCGYQYINDDLARRERSYVARIYRAGSLVPGKVTYWGASAALANSTFSGTPVYEVAVVNPHRVFWVAAANGNIPSGAATAGLTRDGQPLYSCKFHNDRRLSISCGAVQRYTDRCVAEMDGNLVSSPVYEVLVIGSSGGPSNQARAVVQDEIEQPAKPPGRQ